MSITEIILAAKIAKKSMMAEAFSDGSAAYLVPSPRSDNHHPKSSSLHREWNAGWDNAYREALVRG